MKRKRKTKPNPPRRHLDLPSVRVGSVRVKSWSIPVNDNEVTHYPQTRRDRERAECE